MLLDNVVVGNRLVFLLKVNITHARFFLPYNVCYVLVFVLEGNLACARFVSQFHVVVGNLVVCARMKYAIFLDLAMLLLEICM